MFLHTETCDERYYTPSFDGLSLGVSYTPTQEVVDDGELNGQFIARKGGDFAMEAQNVVEGGLVWDGEVGDVEVLASVVGLWGSLRNEAESEFGGDRWWGWQAGATVDLFGVELGGSFADERLGDLDRTFFTAGIGWGEDEWNASITYGQVVDSAGEFALSQALQPGVLGRLRAGSRTGAGRRPGPVRQ